MIFVTVGQDVRFQYGVVLIGLIYLGIPFLNNQAPIDDDKSA